MWRLCVRRGVTGTEVEVEASLSRSPWDLSLVPWEEEESPWVCTLVATLSCPYSWEEEELCSRISRKVISLSLLGERTLAGDILSLAHRKAGEGLDSHIGLSRREESFLEVEGLCHRNLSLVEVLLVL